VLTADVYRNQLTLYDKRDPKQRGNDRIVTQSAEKVAAEAADSE